MEKRTFGQKIKGHFGRHKKKYIIGGVATVGTAVGVKFGITLVKEAYEQGKNETLQACHETILANYKIGYDDAYAEMGVSKELLDTIMKDDPDSILNT